MVETTIPPDEVTAFWLNAGPEKWYKQDEAFDAEIRERFLDLWQKAHDGKLGGWCSNPKSALAMIILTDQFPRNMFRGDPRSFATDALAKKVACYALDRGWDLKIPEPERQFLYMPFMHSERLTDQDHCVRLMAERMKEGNNLLHARAHREIIRKFNRFPYRNEVLGRKTSTTERAFLDDGGYGKIVNGLEAS